MSSERSSVVERQTYDRDIVTLDRDGRTTVRPYKSLLVRFSNRVDSVLSKEILLSLHRNEPVEVVRLMSSRLSLGMEEEAMRQRFPPFCI